MHASQRWQCMSIAFWRNIGFIYPFLIGCQAKLPCKKVKENDLLSPYRIRHKMQRQGEFLKNWLQWGCSKSDASRHRWRRNCVSIWNAASYLGFARARCKDWICRGVLVQRLEASARRAVAAWRRRPHTRVDHVIPPVSVRQWVIAVPLAARLPTGANSSGLMTTAK